MSVEAVPMDESSAIEVNVTTARAKLPEYIELAREGEYVYLTHRGKRVAALVAADVAEHWEEAEDAYWADQVEDAKKSGTVPLREAIVALEQEP
ncbi:type II toxin-antitoxin system prevent-host-death family antitoxin [Saccharopolyspora sp. ID03-671]|uniref:type II toxin-antitoxin system prevent-host-death family antitoxin n=1 Tax=Saccharopolyspora sp. ID03-671 TaxID=3073066 RepID=UPI00324D8082